MAAVHPSVGIFPIRHHSPRSSHVLRSFLDAVRPELVLVEGPADANALVDVLLDPGTTPPVAVLGYRTDGTPGSALWPFATYSPEYVALAWAKREGVPARFIDITIEQVLAARADDSEADNELDVTGPDIHQEVVERFGHRTFDEFWEAAFEAPAYDPNAFKAALVAYAHMVRDVGARRYDRARDAVMLGHIEAAIASGVPAERIVVVLGAAHAAALAAGDVDPSLVSTFAARVPSAATVIPYSFPRLAEQLGYGAGNRAPQYYQRAFDAGCSYRRATLEVLVDFCDHLRLRGYMASLADTIEAYRLACALAALREKAEPGLDEVREATIATMCRGDATHVDSFLWPSVVGKKIGKVAGRVGKNSLQEEFWREVDHRKLPRSDEPEEFVLRLGDPVQVGTSIFLHRLRVADIPYAGFGGSRRGRGAPEEAGSYAALARVRETWQAQWTPSTDVALVERIVLGDTLQDVCVHVLEARLARARATGQAADVLLEAVVTGVPQTVATALAACDRFAAQDDDLPSLARACRALSGLVSFGSSRGVAEVGAEVIGALCQKTFARAVLRVPDACVASADAIAPTKEALRTLHDIALAQPDVDGAAWLAAAQALVASYTVEPSTSGLATGLLYLAQQIDDEAIAMIVAQRLSNTLEPARAAAFLEGFFEVNALVLVKSREVVRALDAYLVAIDKDHFRDALPMLRRAFGPLGATERRYLLENLLALRKLGDKARAAAEVVAGKDKATLAAMSDDIAKAMADLDDLL